MSLIDKINYSRTIEKGKLFCKPLFSKNLKKLSVGSRALKRKNGRFLDEFSTLAAKVKTRKAKVASARLSFHSAASQRDAHGLIQRDLAADARGDDVSALALDACADCARGLPVFARKTAVFHSFALRDGAGKMVLARTKNSYPLPLPQLPSQTREPVSMTLTSGVMLRFSALRKMTPQASSPAIPEKIDSAARKKSSLGSTPSTTKCDGAYQRLVQDLQRKIHFAAGIGNEAGY